MSFYRHTRCLPKRFRLVLASFLQRPGLPFADTLTEEAIQKTFDDEGAGFADSDEVVYTPAVTLWAFLSQVLFKDEQRSCIAAVARVAVLLVALRRGRCSTNTGAYCRARAKLSGNVIRRITVNVGEGCESEVDNSWLWHGRHVHLVDGSTVSMPDTSENQQVYPHAHTQKEGLGFPVARVVVLLSLATGMLTNMAMGPYRGKETGETALLRQLFERFKPGDILLGDRYFCSYFMVALLMELDVDFVTRVHQLRKIDFRRGWRLGKNDHLVRWQLPQRPKWMDQATYDRMPDFIEIREVRVRTGRPGFRTDSFVVVTTLKDAATYTGEALGELYHYRWQVELDIRAIKISMGMDILRCKTPAMVRKEMWTCLLAYNLIRRTMLQSATEAGRLPRQMSFTAAMQSIAASWLVIVLGDHTLGSRLIDAALLCASEHVVNNRPGRIEPRAVKRRPKPIALLTKPRDQARARLIGGKLH